MILVAGTIPVEGFPLTYGRASLEGDTIRLEGLSFPCGMGSGAMISALLETLDFFGLEKPYLITAGDIGDAQGSRRIYRMLEEVIPADKPSIVVMHYLQPIVTLMNSLCAAVESSGARPVMIADAGSLYAAKASGRAGSFSLFTPDAAEMKFLADRDAMHPAYVSNYFLQTGNDNVPELLESAYADGSIPDCVLVKGRTDYVAVKGRVIHTITEPDVPMLEPIGGTGDTITGISAGLIAQGLAIDMAASSAAIINRTAGELSSPRPDTKVIEIIRRIKPALDKTFHKK